MFKLLEHLYLWIWDFVSDKTKAIFIYFGEVGMTDSSQTISPWLFFESLRNLNAE